MPIHERNNNSTERYIAPKSALPSSRRGKATAKQKTTLLYRTPFHKFIYIISALAFAFLALQVWRLLQLKSAVGGWRNLVLGVPLGGEVTNRNSKVGGDTRRDSIEDRINDLAEALGLTSHDLASAIADAVRSHVHPQSLSSEAAAEVTKKGTATILAGEKETPKQGSAIPDSLGAMAGFDDPVDMEY